MHLADTFIKSDLQKNRALIKDPIIVVQNARFIRLLD